MSPRIICALTWLLSVLILSGCAITVDVPVNRFDTPETVGKRWRVKVDAAVGGMDEVTLTPDGTISPPSTSSPTFDRSAFFQLGGGVALLDNLDLELKNFSSLEAKFQFLGDPRFTAKAGNFSMAVTLASGFVSDSGSGSGISGVAYSMNKEQYFVDSALIAGYRPLDWLMVYTGPFARETAFTGNYSSGPNPNQLGVPSSFSGSVLSYGADLGVEAGTPLFQFRVEGAYGQVISGTLNTGQAYLGGQLAFNFGPN